MINHPRRTLALAAAFILAAAGAQAQGKGHGNGNDKDQEKGKDNGHQSDSYEKGRGNDKHQDNVQRREIVQRHENEQRRDVYNNNSGRAIPPGLARKPGGMPPGQYKKHYSTQQGAGVLRDIFVNRGYTVVRTVNAGPSQYVYYRMSDGSVRRAVVSPGTDQLGFSNVPQALLREVLARLY